MKDSTHVVAKLRKAQSAEVMGTRRHGQGWGTDPRKCYKVFCALVVTVKRSVDQLFLHHFNNFLSASGGHFAASSNPGPHWESFVSIPPNLSTPGKNPAGVHGRGRSYRWTWGGVSLPPRQLPSPPLLPIAYLNCNNDNLNTETQTGPTCTCIRLQKMWRM